MLTTIRRNARDITQLVCAELASISAKEKKKADNHMEVTKLTYQKWKNEDYPKAEQRHAEVISGYRAGEAKKLQAFKERDDARKPTSDANLAEMVSNRVSRDPDVLKKVELEMQLLSLDEPNQELQGERKKRKQDRSITPPGTPDYAEAGPSNTYGRGREQQRNRNKDRRERSRESPYQGSRQNSYQRGSNQRKSNNDSRQNRGYQQQQPRYDQRNGYARGKPKSDAYKGNKNQNPNKTYQKGPKQQQNKSKQSSRMPEDERQLFKLLFKRVMGDD
jgi:hypothetical protein